jgi:hypothetical protein
VKKPNWNNCSTEVLWKFVATHLSRQGIDTVLVGGAVVTIYSEGAYPSDGLDLVQLNHLSQDLPKAMSEIGFELKDNRHYQHPHCKHLFLEFSSGPIGIGNDTRISPDEMRVDGTVIKIFSPTDCIRDRLASTIHFNAMECLDQAILVAKNQPFNDSRIKKWCASEGSPETYKEFKSRLQQF